MFSVDWPFEAVDEGAAWFDSAEIGEAERAEDRPQQRDQVVQAEALIVIPGRQRVTRNRPSDASDRSGADALTNAFCYCFSATSSARDQIGSLAPLPQARGR